MSETFDFESEERKRTTEIDKTTTMTRLDLFDFLMFNYWTRNSGDGFARRAKLVDTMTIDGIHVPLIEIDEEDDI